MQNRSKRFVIKMVGAMAFGAIWALAWNKPIVTFIPLIAFAIIFWLGVLIGVKRDFSS